MNEQISPEALTAKDFTSDQEVRWCPGCGDYAILKCMQRTLPQLGVTRENTVFISGIGCSSRFPYYMNTFGFHTIHGRAPAVATGVKLANPDLDVWVITGDGDGLSIGGNHLLHALRRNVNLNIILFNNEIYGLTKGQYSPTSFPGTKSPSTPHGSVDHRVSVCAFALGVGAHFIARTIDTDQKRMPEVFRRAHQFKGSSFVEIWQNCPVYNDKVFEEVTNKREGVERQLHVVHGEPLIFGKAMDKGLRIVPGTLDLEVVTLGESGITEADILIHDEHNRTLAGMLVRLGGPDFPVAFGVLYNDPAQTFEDAVHEQIAQVTAKKGPGDLNALLHSGRTWEVS